MKTFKYKTILVPLKFWSKSVDTEEVDKILNKLGSVGWELVAVQSSSSSGSDTGFYYTFKLEI